MMKAPRILFILMVVAALAWLSAISPLEAADMMNIETSRYSERPPVNDATLAGGREIFNRSCMPCHGVDGKGDGPAALYLSRDLGPQPRDFTRGVYKFRSTPTGTLPADDDLFRTVTNGVVGFMPPFAGLEPADRWMVIYYIKSLFPWFEGSIPETVQIKGYPLPASAQSTRRGYEVYQKFGCQECHGGGGKGNGSSAPYLRDDRGFLLPPTDLTMPNSFKNGHRPEDIYRTLVTGLNGSPMPSYASFFEVGEEDLWHLVNFIMSLSEGRQ